MLPLLHILAVPEVQVNKDLPVGYLLLGKVLLSRFYKDMVMVKVPEVLVGLNIELAGPDVSLLVGRETDSRVSSCFWFCSQT